MNWLDILILVFLGSAIFHGFREGFVRQGVGLMALVAGFFAAAWFHGLAAASIEPYVPNHMAASLLGYLVVFVAVLILGGLIAALIVRVFHLVGLTFVDRVLGGAFGLVRGGLVIVVATMVMMAFAPRRLPNAVNHSRLMPHVFRGANVLSAMTPYELKHGVEQTYAELRELVRGVKKLPTREE